MAARNCNVEVVHNHTFVNDNDVDGYGGGGGDDDNDDDDDNYDDDADDDDEEEEEEEDKEEEEEEDDDEDDDDDNNQNNNQNFKLHFISQIMWDRRNQDRIMEQIRTEGETSNDTSVEMGAQGTWTTWNTTRWEIPDSVFGPLVSR
ncbi:hypothetical protein DPMN_157012 [Dreissena polymorpha]|uniref:Uncharacterized protein n=1 Tax=Dreissena polymorpha TaxID=45954 RepID=A0A9D4FU78_DREPO|nr:hypothetical protein DPMN_157012 [Dreissena polymorpha]